MSYRLSVDSFDSTFAVKEDGSKLTHYSGKRFKLFPFIANNNSALIYDLDTIVGRYISQIEGIIPEKLSVEELTEKLKEDTSVDAGMDELFHNQTYSFAWEAAGQEYQVPPRLQLILCQALRMVMDLMTGCLSAATRPFPSVSTASAQI